MGRKKYNGQKDTIQRVQNDSFSARGIQLCYKRTESCGFPAEATPARARTARANFILVVLVCCCWSFGESESDGLDTKWSTFVQLMRAKGWIFQCNEERCQGGVKVSFCPWRVNRAPRRIRGQFQFDYRFLEGPSLPPSTTFGPSVKHADSSVPSELLTTEQLLLLPADGIIVEFSP